MSLGHLSSGLQPRFFNAFAMETLAPMGINFALSNGIFFVKSIESARPLLGLMNQEFPFLPLPASWLSVIITIP